MKFNKRRARDQVLRVLEAKERKWEGETVSILREIPLKIHQKQRIYKEFAELLRKNNIKYKWLVPEGLFSLTKQEGIPLILG